MNRTEFNSFSFLEMENEILRARIIMKDKEIECYKDQIAVLNKIIKRYENSTEDLHKEQAGTAAG